MDDMHNFFVMPFRAVIKPGDTVTITLGIKCNWKNYDKDEVEKRTEMRKLLNVRLTDTRINIVVPLCIHFASKNKEEAD